MKLVPVKRLSLKSSASLPRLLDYLGVDYHKKPGVSFADANRALLPEIQREMLSEARSICRELHPDNGGDARAFDLFVTALARAKRFFAWNLHGCKAQNDVTFLPKRDDANQHQRGFYMIEQSILIIGALRNGANAKDIKRQFGACGERSAALRGLIRGVIVSCTCGRPSNHTGVCSHRLGQSVKWKQRSARMRGTTKSEQTKERMRAAWVIRRAQKLMKKTAVTMVIVMAALVCAGQTVTAGTPKKKSKATPVAPTMSVKSENGATTATTPVNSVSLSWDPSPDKDIGGYRVKWGTKPGQWDKVSDDVGPTDTSLFIPGLDPTVMYYFVVIAIDTDGQTSVPSNEASGYPWTGGGPTPTPKPSPNPGSNLKIVEPRLANISTRAFIGTGNDVMIGGFIITGSPGQMARYLVRAIGPSLSIDRKLLNPKLEIHDATGSIIVANDNWKDTQEKEIIATTVPPTDKLEAAAVVTLAPGGYTVVVAGSKGIETGIGVVEVYAL